MKNSLQIRRKILAVFGFSAWMLAQTGSFAMTIDLLGIESREEGDTTVGTNLIVRQTDSGRKFVQGNGDTGQFLAAVNMPMESEIWMGMYLADSYRQLVS